ncbi:MAG: hypothetical protein O2816_17790 [Planctomycetota bacterium]|nr:hypothetical protein [Planctomycetota bacterium]
MPLGKKRIQALYGILHQRARPHRYTLWRWGVGIVFTAGIAALAWSDTLRFDFWRGRHMWLGQQVGLSEGLRKFAFPFLALNVAIIVVTRFCGFVCPVGTLGRLGEWARHAERKRRQRIFGPLLSLGVCLLLAAITFSFWVDPLVFVEGSARAVLWSSALLAALSGGLFVIVQGLGLRFCRELCPSGIYFAVLGHDSRSGIEFAHPDACSDCGLCNRVCPMDLEPRAMSGGAHREARGLYPDGLSNFANCIRCGDCIVACEVGSTEDEATALRFGPLPVHARDARAPVKEP